MREYNTPANCPLCRFLRGLAISTLGGLMGGIVAILLGFTGSDRFYAVVLGVLLVAPFFFRQGEG